jgi:Domain of unknown function (DUF4336)
MADKVWKIADKPDENPEVTRDMIQTYPPLNTLKRVTDDVWIVDGPIIRFGLRWLKLPFPTRMTVLRIRKDDLFIHSPTPLAENLKSEIERVGKPRWIIGPNRIHYWWIPEWKSAFPQAEVHLAPRIKEQAGYRIDFDAFPLDKEGGYPWAPEIATLPVSGTFMTEFVFFHRASRSLILTDLIENFERNKLDSCWIRGLVRLGGVLDPNGEMPRDMRLTFPKPRLRKAVETMLGWEPERVLLAHGKWYARSATNELRRAFEWALT